jgi:tether containing UBX domain for GLUT4
MCKLEQARAIMDVMIQLQLPDTSRYTGSFKPSISLQEMLEWYRAQSERFIIFFIYLFIIIRILIFSMIAALDVSINSGDKLYPVCSYMSEEVIGEYALTNTTLRELGLTSGTAVIR